MRLGAGAARPLLWELDVTHQRMQLWQIGLDRFPDDLQVYVEVAVRQCVAHLVRVHQRQLRVRGGKLRENSGSDSNFGQENSGSDSNFGQNWFQAHVHKTLAAMF